MTLPVMTATAAISILSRPGLAIFGASGPIGQALRRHAGARTAALTYCGRPFPGGRAFDVVADRIDDLAIAWDGIAAAIILAGRANPDWCADNPELSRRINVDGICHLADGLSQRGVKVVFASSEAVYHGPGPHREDEDVQPLTTYGRQKLAVETHLRAFGPGHLIVRISRAVGTTAGDGTLITQLYGQMRRGGDLALAGDQVFSPVHLDEAAAAIVRLIDRGAAGTYNLGGPQAVSRIDLAHLLRQAVQDGGGPADGAVIRAVPIASFSPREPRPLDTSMDISKIEAATGMTFTPPSALCAAIVAGVS